MSETAVILVRHGETVWNRELRFQGHTDSPLSELGVRQVRSLGRRFAGMSFGALYSSDTGRAYRTAKSIAETTAREVVVDPRLRERNFGVFEGLTLEEIKAQQPETYRLFRSGDPDFVIPHGESARATYRRVVACFEELAARHRGDTVVVVSHGIVLDALYRHVVGMPLDLPRTLKLFNASLNTFYRTSRGWRTGALGDIEHLGDGAMVLG